MTLIDKTQNQWTYILEASGIDKQFLKNRHGPCPICGGKDRFRFDDKVGRGTYICNQCGAGDGIKLLMRYREFSFKEAINFIEHTLDGNLKPMDNTLKRLKPTSQCAKEQKKLKIKRKSLQTIWYYQSKPVTHGDPVDRYLQARGIRLNVFPNSLRYHPNLDYYHEGKIIGTFPAMIALVQDQYNQQITLHRTYLDNECKADVPNPKKLMSPVIAGSSLGGSIQLYPPTDDGTLALAEGIETALAVHVATTLPVWSTVNALGMKNIILPPSIKNVVIAVDNDYSNTGQKSGTNLAFRLINNDKKVKIIMPPTIGHDFADLLLEENQE